MSGDLVKRPEDYLTPLESEALQRWRRSTDAAPLSTSVALRMYELFLLGHTCEEVVRANDNKFSLGMVIDARIRHEWDRRRESYLDTLYSEAGNIVKQRQIETALFLGDVLAATHKRYGPQLQKFMQTGDPNDLPATFQADTITKYKMVIDAVARVTGQDKKDSGPAVQVIGNNIDLGMQKPVSGQEAFSILQSLEKLEGKKK